jgi:putative transport protein
MTLFLYSVGVQYGGQFFGGLTTPARRRANLVALIGVLCSGAVSLLLVEALGLNLAQAMGLFAGSGASTPSLQAALVAFGNDDPAVAYSVVSVWRGRPHRSSLHHLSNPQTSRTPLIPGSSC